MLFLFHRDMRIRVCQPRPHSLKWTHQCERQLRLACHRPFLRTSSPALRALFTSTAQFRSRLDRHASSRTQTTASEIHATRLTPPSPDQQPQDNSPEIWVSRLEQFLPHKLRTSVDTSVSENPDTDELIELLRSSRSSLQSHFGEPLDLLTYALVAQGRYEAVLHIIDRLLGAGSIPTLPTQKDVLPSNIQWPAPLSKAGQNRRLAFDVGVFDRPSADQPRAFDRDLRITNASKESDAALSHVWHFLGVTIILSANSHHGDAQALLNVAHRALAKVHHLNLVPKDIYSYSSNHLSSHLRRPPILHLLSSRILTTLSDVMWRAQQDDAISQAADAGIPYRQLGRDPPGGRFRLKVRDIGPEAWLELVLWCCVEGGFESTAESLIDLIRTQTEHPWFAVKWTGPDNRNLVDWNRVGMRTGGAVGRVEGYSGEEPLVNIPKRTISVEVVLALVDSLFLASVNHKHSGSLLERVSRLFSFLEPHSLRTEYFDYLTTRTLQVEAVDLPGSPELMQSWSRTLHWIRNLASTLETPKIDADLRYPSIINHSELQAGLLHQVLHAYLQAGYTNESIDAFSDIQQLVDGSKLQAISSFINSPMKPSKGFFDSPYWKKDPDFLDSHGRLPFHRLIAVLNMFSENKLIGLGQWLLYSVDVDGPLIPYRSLEHPSMNMALVRYASECSDPILMKRLAKVATSWRLKPTVEYLRTMFNALVRRREFSNARKYQTKLMESIGGGHSPENIATLASVVLDLESIDGMGWQLKEASLLMWRMLEGITGEGFGTFSQQQRTAFDRQIGSILRIFHNIPSPQLNEFAQKCMGRFPTGNVAGLAPTTFDILLKSVVARFGAAEGRRLWDMFCQDPGQTLPSDERPGVQSEVPQKSDELPPHEWRGPLYEDVAGEADPSSSEETVAHGASGIMLNSDLVDNPYLANIKATKPTPVVVPTVKTIRIITRGALLELSQEPSGQQQPELRDILNWTGQQFRAFGRSEAVIRRELQMADTAAETEQVTADLAMWAPAREKVEVDVSKQFRGREVAGRPGWSKRASKSRTRRIRLTQDK